MTGARPLRIGLVCPYSFDVPGGVQHHVRELAAELQARGHQIRVLGPGVASADLPDDFTTTGRTIPVRFNGAVARLAFGPRAITLVRHWLSAGELDILHIHEPAAPSVSLLALWASEVPVVATFHYATSRSRLVASTAGVLGPAMEKISARIAVSEAARATLVAHVGGEPVVIPNGIDVASFADAAPVEEWRGPGPAIGFLARGTDPRKGLLLLVEAMTQVWRSHPTARLVVAGPGDVPPVLRRIPPDPRVRVLGRLDSVDRARFLASLDVFVAPHLGGESFGVVLLEAMAAGTPLVASDLQAFRAVLSDGDAPPAGDLFEAGDPVALAAAIAGLLDDTSRRQQLRALGRLRAARYDWSRVVPDIEAIYRAVARPGTLAAAGHP